MRFELIDSYEKFCLLKNDWEGLESRANNHVFQSHKFLDSWIKCVGLHSYVQLATVAIWDGQLLVAVFPGCVVKKYGVKFLTWLGGFYIIDYGDIICDTGAEKDIDTFIDGSIAIIKTNVDFRIAYFHNVRSDSPTYECFTQHFISHRKDVSHIVVLENDFENYLDSLKKNRKKLKSDTLRQIKRLSEIGRLDYVVLSSGDTNRGHALEKLFQLKKRRYRDSSVDGVLFKAGYENFYKEQSVLNPACHVSCLLLDDEVLATHVGYAYKDTYYYLMPAYNMHYDKYSPGRVLMYNLIKNSYEKGLGYFDLCVGDESYKHEWANGKIDLTSFVSNNITGKLFKLGYGLRSTLRGKC